MATKAHGYPLNASMVSVDDLLSIVLCGFPSDNLYDFKGLVQQQTNIELCPCTAYSTANAFFMGVMNGLIVGDERKCNWNLVVIELNRFTPTDEFWRLQLHIYAHLYETQKTANRHLLRSSLHDQVKLLPKEQLLLHHHQFSFG
jgi:hypothetical protein